MMCTLLSRVATSRAARRRAGVQRPEWATGIDGHSLALSGAERGAGQDRLARLKKQHRAQETDPPNERPQSITDDRGPSSDDGAGAERPRRSRPAPPRPAW